MTRSFKALLLAVFVTPLMVSPALAHTAIKVSNIESGATLNVAPETFDFAFGSAVGLAGLTLETIEGIALPFAFDPPAGLQKTFSVKLPGLTPDAYVLKWRAVAKDGHVMTGEVAFTITE